MYPETQQESASPIARIFIKLGIITNERDARAIVVFSCFVVFLIAVWIYVDANKRADATEEVPEVPYPTTTEESL